MAAFYLDHNISYGWRFALQDAGHAVDTARDRHLEVSKDYDVLGIAAAQGWIVVTHNAKDFQLLHGAWLSWPDFWGLGLPRTHAGILVFPHGLPAGRVASVIDELLAIQPSLANRLFIWHRDRGWTGYIAMITRLH